MKFTSIAYDIKFTDSLMKRILPKLLGMNESATLLARPPYSAPNNRQGNHLREIGRSFLAGYNRSLAGPDFEDLSRHLDQAPPRYVGFGYEGAAMGYALCDFLTPWNRYRWRSFVQGKADAHRYVAHVGAGWLLARVPVKVNHFLEQFDSILCWLAIDGYGFHEGFFHGKRYLSHRRIPNCVQGFGGRAFDQGFGRCLWFLECANIEAIGLQIAQFPMERRADLWSGVGLAAVYAGESQPDELRQLLNLSGDYRPQLQQGAAFAAKARLRGKCSTAYTELASEALCGIPAEEAAALTDEALADLPKTGIEPPYEVWRSRVQQWFIRRKIPSV